MARKPRKVIITCAVTGSIHTPSMSPYLPITAEEIADAAVGAAQAGAAIVHLHARKPDNGEPLQTPEGFANAHKLAPLGQASRPEDIAQAVLFAATNPAMTGTTLLVDGGQHLMGFARDFSMMNPADGAPRPTES